jgi:alpha-L-rhamnosidase
MTSFNHYALGAVSMFLYQTVGGISPLLPGWKRALIRPSPGGTVTWAEVSHVTPYGKLSCKWRIRGQQLAVDVEVPPNTTARVELPGIVVEKGSGVWDFVVPWEGNDVWPPKVLQPPPLRPQLVDEIVA